MSSAFRSFATILSEEESVGVLRTSAKRSEPPSPPPIMPPEVPAPPADGASPQIAALLASFAAEIALMRARAAELVENEAESLLQMIASNVLVRELELAPVDIRALTERVRSEWNAGHRLRFRIAAADREKLAGLDGTLETDPALQPGDLQVEFADGVLDLRLGTRLAGALERHHISV